MLATLATKLDDVFASWARRRQGPDSSSGITLNHRRIYILPTRHGAAYSLVVFAMLLGSINYNASLGYALTFLLTGLGLVIMHHCHNNLLYLQLRFAGASPVFAGETAKFKISVTNDSSTPRYEIEIAGSRRGAKPMDLMPHDSDVAEISVTAKTRGWQRLSRFAILTQYPGNLFQAWSWMHMDARCLVYPRPAPPGRPIPEVTGGSQAGRRRHEGGADFYGLRNATAFDSPKRIAWKASARSDVLLVKQFVGSENLATMLDWDSLPELDTEARLSQLARWCLDSTSEARKFGLRLPDKLIPADMGREHLHSCLTALALYGLGDPA